MKRTLGFIPVLVLLTGCLYSTGCISGKDLSFEEKKQAQAVFVEGLKDGEFEGEVDMELDHSGSPLGFNNTNRVSLGSDQSHLRLRAKGKVKFTKDNPAPPGN